MLAHGQEALLRPDLRSRVVVVFRVADRTEEDSIALETDLMGLLGISRSVFVDRAGSGLRKTVFNLVSETGANCVHGFLGLCNYLRSYAVARQFSNFESHYFKLVISRFSMILSILTVALMAASVWSESMPRVLNSCPSMFHTMVVATRASVLPPGGMVTW